MKIFHVLPENERNNFQNPIQHLRSQQPVIDVWFQVLNPVQNDLIRGFGEGILVTLRKPKPPSDDSENGRMKVSLVIKAVKKELKDLQYTVTAAMAALPGIAEEILGIRACMTDALMDGYALTAMKLLANDGFIKLSKATKFENREVLQYHATAVPHYRSGKFRL